MKKFLIVFLISIILISGSTYCAQINITDIEGHWAQENIVRMIINENLNGYPDNTFRPDNEVSVLEFFKIISDVLNIKLVEDGLTKWPDYYISTAQQYGINYDFNKKLTRDEAVDIISKLIDLSSISLSNNRFKDINTTNKNEILKLVKLKIINGYEDGTFRGENLLTRAEAVTIVLRVLEANQMIINNKKYDINSKYTNINVYDAEKSEINKIRYEVIDDKIYFFDSGRFSNVQAYSIDETNITNKKLLSIIKSLVSEGSYTAVYYVPSDYIINQIIVKYGETDRKVNQNLEFFSFTYYEDKLYDLNHVTSIDEFTSECYMKISLKKLWKEQYKYEQGNFIDENIKYKLEKAIKAEFGKDSNLILEYLLKVYEYSMYSNEDIIEQNQIGNYFINVFKTDNTNLEFYFEKA